MTSFTPIFHKLGHTGATKIAAHVTNFSIQIRVIDLKLKKTIRLMCRNLNIGVLMLISLLTGCEAKVNDAGMTLPLDTKGIPMQPKTPYEQWLTDKPSYFNFTEQLQLAIPVSKILVAKG